MADDAVDSAEIVDGAVDLAHLSATGTKSSSTFLRGDNTWNTPPNDNTWRGIDDTPVDGQTAESISSNWAHDHNAGTGNSKHVPAAGSSGQFLKHDGTWGTPPDTNTNILSGGNINGTTYLPDNTSMYWGTGNDLRIRHNSGDNASYITESGAGHLYINADDFQVWNTAGNEIKAKFITDGGVELRYNNHPTFLTRSDGIEIKAPEGASANLYLAADEWDNYTDAWALTSYTDGVFKIANHVSSGNYEASIYAAANGKVAIYYDGSNKLETSSTGVTVTGTCTATTFSGSGASLTNIGTSSIANDAITSDKIADNAINASAMVSNGVVTHDKLAWDSVDDTNIIDNSVKLEHMTSESVDEDNLKISNSGSNGQFLSKQSGNTGGLTWADVPAGVGGSSGVDFNDTVKARWGTGNDLEIFHDGNDYIKSVGTGDLYIDCVTGDLQIRGTGFSVMGKFIDDGAVELYYDGSKKFETTSYGGHLTGEWRVEGGDLFLDDDDYKLKIGEHSDLLAYHDSGNNYLDGVNGNLYIRNRSAGGGSVRNAIVLNASAGTELYYDNDKKAETVSGGFSVTGNIVVSGTVDGRDLQTDGTKLDGIASSANNYTHPTSAGNKHIPSGGSSGQYLKYDSSGTAVWADVSTGVTSDSDENTVAGTNAGDSITSGQGARNTTFGYNAGTALTTGDDSTAIGAGALDVCETTSYNTAIGSYALSASTADKNTAIGAWADLSNVSGSSNVSIGFAAHQDGTSGDRNVCIGNEAGKSTTGSDNIAIGTSALQRTSSGSYNTAIGGRYTLHMNTGQQNTVVGYAAAQGTGSGGKNTVVGCDALRTNTNYEEQTAIGFEALYTANGANRNTAVGSKAGHDITSGGDNTILGAYAGDALTTGSGNIIIGYNAAASAVGVSNEITLGDTNITKFRIPGLNFVVKDSTATEDYVLTVDANGEAGWEAASGGGPGDINTSAGYESPATLADNWTIGANNNAMFPGPMTVAANKTVTVPANRTLTVV